MRGLRMQDTSKFETFFKLVQNAAKEKGAIFFVDAGDGHEEEFANMTCEDLSGWLIPEKLADQFESEWKERPFNSEKWDEKFFGFAVWRMENGRIKIEFNV